MIIWWGGRGPCAGGARDARGAEVHCGPLARGLQLPVRTGTHTAIIAYVILVQRHIISQKDLTTPEGSEGEILDN
jgi:hypothetical protein